MRVIGRASLASGIVGRIVADAHELRQLHHPTGSHHSHGPFCQLCGPAYCWPCTRRERADAVIDCHQPEARSQQPAPLPRDHCPTSATPARSEGREWTRWGSGERG
jgi:hypothetical protein